MVVLEPASHGRESYVRRAMSVLSFRLGDAAEGGGVAGSVGLTGAAGVGVADAAIVDARVLVQVQIQIQVHSALNPGVHHHAST
jgi:hypothetical protein